jgi:succinate dehydrogenase / fumarate reductase cytochrome b subunit
VFNEHAMNSQNKTSILPRIEGTLPARRTPLSWDAFFYRSTVGKKIIVAVTGFIGVAYVGVHMLGNLQVFAGPAQLNSYAALLKSNGGLLWIARIVLAIAVVLHIVIAYQLTWRCQKSRRIAYSRWQAVASTFASRTMTWSGPIIGTFIIYHLLHFTTGTVHPDFHPDAVYRNVVTGFRIWYVSLFYIVAMLALGLHMYHGVWSMFKSFGVNDPEYNGLIRGVATCVTLAVVIGFISIPLAVLLGIIS